MPCSKASACCCIPKDRRVRSDEAVRVRLGADEFEATGLEYREDTGVLELLGPMRGIFAPRTP
jgi:lipopolysaccharide export system protein LptC